MRKLLIAALFIIGTQINVQAQTSAAKNNKLKIEEGTLIRVRSLSEINSKTATEGDVIDFAVFEDLMVDGKVVIKEGTIAHAIVEESAKARSIGKEGTLKIAFLNTKAVDGTKVPLRATKSTIAGDSKGRSAVALAVVVSPLFLFKKGKEAKIAPGKMMEAYIANEVEVVPN